MMPVNIPIPVPAQPLFDLELLKELAEAGKRVILPNDPDLPKRLRCRNIPATRLLELVGKSISALQDKHEYLQDADNALTMAKQPFAARETYTRRMWQNRAKAEEAEKLACTLLHAVAFAVIIN